MLKLVVISLILKMKDILILAAKFVFVSTKSVLHMKGPQIVIGNICGQTGENTGNFRIKFEFGKTH